MRKSEIRQDAQVSENHEDILLEIEEHPDISVGRFVLIIPKISPTHIWSIIHNESIEWVQFYFRKRKAISEDRWLQIKIKFHILSHMLLSDTAMFTLYGVFNTYNSHHYYMLVIVLQNFFSSGIIREVCFIVIPREIWWYIFHF